MIRAGSAARRSFTRSANTGGPLILDVVAVSAAAAYSLRRLRAAYTGAAVNVRRSSDSATQDIGFVNGSLDTSALAAFIGAGSGFIAKWYDQSGNSNDAVQATAANQLQIVVSIAALSGRSGLLSVDALGAAVTAPSVSGIDSIFAAGGFNSNVVNYTGGATQKDRIWDKGAVTLSFETAGQSDVAFHQSAATTTGTWKAPNLTTGAHIIEASYNSASLSNVATITYDGTAQSTTNTQPVGALTADAGTGLSIGSNGGGGTRGWPGHFAELIFWKTTVPSAAQITTLRANQKAYWGTP